MSLEKINMNAEDIFAFEVVGEICKNDYTDILFPIFEQARNKGMKLRLLLHFGNKFEGYTKEAVWQDFKLGFKFLRVVDRCAIVSDKPWIVNLSSFFGSLIPCTVETFMNEDFESAKAWIKSGELALDYFLDEENSLLNIEISAPLNSLNFEVMTSAVDTYLERNGTLNGLLIHTKKFPGWENIGSLISHIEFVSSHHKKIKKVAFVTNSKLVDVIPTLTRHFVKADIENFSFDEMDKAKRWIMKI